MMKGADLDQQDKNVGEGGRGGGGVETAKLYRANTHGALPGLPPA